MDVSAFGESESSRIVGSLSRSPAIWFDATTVIKLRRQPPVGLTRVEANALRGAMHMPHGLVRFCCFNRYRSQLEPVDRSAIELLLESYGRPASSGRSGGGHGSVRQRGPLSRAARALERGIRIGSRRLIGGLRKKAPGGSEVFWVPGDTLVISGGSWDCIEAAYLKSLVDRCSVKLVTVIADMIPVLYPHHFEDAAVIENFHRYAACAASHASLVLHISNATKDDFDAFATRQGITPARSEVIYLGADQTSTGQVPSSMPAGLPHDLLERGFALSVSTIQVRKNHQLLYQLWRRFAEEGRADAPRLVLVGGAGWMTDDLRRQIARDPAVADSICVLNRADDGQLNWLYDHCRFTLYPSLYEGWGLPIVESLQRGKPCIASNTSSMPEASQALAMHLDPLDFAAWRAAVLRWTEHPEELAAWSRDIRQSFHTRSWDDFGHEFCSRVASIHEAFPEASTGVAA